MIWFWLVGWPATEKLAGVESVAASPTTPGASVASVLKSLGSSGRRLAKLGGIDWPVPPGSGVGKRPAFRRACTVTGASVVTVLLM